MNVAVVGVIEENNTPMVFTLERCVINVPRRNTAMDVVMVSLWVIKMSYE